MLLSKLRVVFENAAGEIELWSKAASAQVELQLRERRRGFARRREALQRVQAAAGELEQRIAEVEPQDERLAGLQCAAGHAWSSRPMPVPTRRRDADADRGAERRRRRSAACASGAV